MPSLRVWPSINIGAWKSQYPSMDRHEHKKEAKPRVEKATLRLKIVSVDQCLGFKKTMNYAVMHDKYKLISSSGLTYLMYYSHVIFTGTN